MQYKCNVFINKSGDKNEVFLSIGVARDSSACKPSKIQKIVLHYNDSCRINNINKVYQAMTPDGLKRTELFVTFKDAENSFIKKYGNIPSVIASYNLNKQTYQSLTDKKIDVVFQKSTKGDGFVAYAYVDPNKTGYKYNPPTIIFPDRNWIDVEEGPATIAITYYDKKHIASCVGFMIPFHKLYSYDDVKKFVEESVTDNTFSIVTVKSKSRFRGEYSALFDEDTDTYYLFDSKTKHLNAEYSDFIKKDILDSYIETQ